VEVYLYSLYACIVWYVIKYRKSLHLYGCFVKHKCADIRSFVEITSASMFMDMSYRNIVCGAY
jgi:hypothetical protein